jgi:hypothetical protein
MITVRLVLHEIARTNQVTAKQLSVRLGNFTFRQTLDTLGRLQRAGLIELSGGGTSAAIQSRYATAHGLIDAARAVGVDVDSPIACPSM